MKKYNIINHIIRDGEEKTWEELSEEEQREIAERIKEKLLNTAGLEEIQNDRKMKFGPPY